MSELASTNYFSVNPIYSIEAKFPDEPPGWVAAANQSDHVYLHGLTAEEVKVLSAYFIRRGVVYVNVIKVEPITFRQKVTEDSKNCCVRNCGRKKQRGSDYCKSCDDALDLA